MMATEEVAVDKDLNLLNEDEIQDHRLSKKRDHSKATLNSLLHSEIGLLVKTKVKENIMQYSLEFHLQVLQKIKKSLNEPVSNLKARKEELQQHSELQNVYKSQLVNEMLTTEKIINMLLEHYKQLQTTYECELKNVTELKAKHTQQLSLYESKKESILKQINDIKAYIRSIKNDNERDSLKSEFEVNKRMDDINQITESINQINTEIESCKNERETVKTEYDRNNLMVIGLNQNIGFVQNSVNNHSSLIEELETQRMKDKENNDLIFKNITNELGSYTKVLSDLERKENELQEACAKESNKSKELEDLFSKLDDEKADLESEREQLIEKRDDFLNKSSVEQLNLNNEMNTIQSKHTELRERLNVIMLTKENKLKHSRWLQQTTKEAEEKLSDLQNLKNKSVKESLLNKVREDDLLQREMDMKEKINVLKSSLATIHHKHLQEKESNQKLKSDLDYKLLTAQSQLQEVTNQYQVTLKNIESEVNDYKCQLQAVDLQNQEHYKEALDELTDEVTKLKTDLNVKSKCLNETNQLLPEKKELCEKLKEELNDLRKNGLSNCSFNEPTPSAVKPTGILKSPGKTGGISPKRVKFDV